MQKKIVALAIAGLVSAGAYAQSNVQIYGIIDYGYSYRHDMYKAAKNVKGFHHSKSHGTFDSGQSAGNRLGFKGVEDLGNGLKAVFVLERGFALDTGADIAGFNRQAYVGLSGNWGTLAGGLINTPYYTLISAIDPFGGTTVGAYQNVKRDIANTVTGVTTNGGIFDPVRVKNSLAYISPNWGIFSFVAAFSNNALADDNEQATKAAASSSVGADGTTITTTKAVTRWTNAKNNTVYTVGGNLKGEKYLVGLTYHHISVGNTARESSGLKGVNDVTLGGYYDFGVVKLSAFWSWDQVKYSNKATAGKNRKTWNQNNFMIGATVPFGKHAVKASVNFSTATKDRPARNADGTQNVNAIPYGGRAWQLAVGYTYNFSKRTNFYAVYSYINNKNQTKTKVGRAAVVNDAQNSGGVYQQGFQLGLKHSF